MITISSVSFGVAFLAGYSINGLFSLLDRLIKNLPTGGDADDAKYKPPTPAPDPA